MIQILKKTFLYNFPDEILLEICSHLTSHELSQLALSCQALSRVACEVLSRALKLDFAYYDDQKLPQVNEIVNKLKRRSIGFLSDITIAHLAWPVSSQLCRRMHHILSMLPNLQTLHLKQQSVCYQGYFIRDGLLDANLYDVLLASPSATTIRSLTVSEPRISSHDILRLFTMKQLEHLSIEAFNYPMGIEPGPSAPRSQLQSLSISTTARPTGRHIDIILARLPKLKRFAWKFDFSSVSTQEKFTKVCSPAAISAALDPVKSTLEELRIEMVRTEFRNDGTGLHLEGYEKLRRVRVHEDLLFSACHKVGYGAVCHGLGAQLPDRLPRNLQKLEIISDAHGGDQIDCCLGEERKSIFDLGSQKTHFRNLNHVSVIRRKSSASKE